MPSVLRSTHRKHLYNNTIETFEENAFTGYSGLKYLYLKNKKLKMMAPKL
jgi:hypothetical protein